MRRLAQIFHHPLLRRSKMEHGTRQSGPHARCSLDIDTIVFFRSNYFHMWLTIGDGSEVKIAFSRKTAATA